MGIAGVDGYISLPLGSPNESKKSCSEQQCTCITAMADLAIVHVRELAMDGTSPDTWLTITTVSPSVYSNKLKR